MDSGLDRLISWNIPLEYRNVKLTCEISLPLFEQFPELRNRLPFVSLGNYPTCVKQLSGMSKLVGANFYIKNDGLSGVVGGGNKVRKLRFSLGEALDSGSSEVLTVGAAGSNCALATTVCASIVGLKSTIMMTPQINTSYLKRNLLLNYVYGADMYFYPDENTRNSAIIDKFLEYKSLHKNNLYFIPFGGSNPIGTIGYIDAIFELRNQINMGILPCPDVIYISMCTAGTAAGLLVGLRVAGLKSKLVIVCDANPATTDTHQLITLANRTSSLLHGLDNNFPEIILTERDVNIHPSDKIEIYANISPETSNAIKLMYDIEGIKLDGTYSGKTFAALLRDKANFKGKNVLFWDTFCAGTFEELTSKVDYKKLPKDFHRFFEEPVHPFDQGC